MARGNMFARNLEAPMVARKDFTFNGRKLKGGDEFPWRKMAIAERKVQQLINSGHVAYAGDRKRDPNVGRGTTPAAQVVTTAVAAKRIAASNIGLTKLVARAGGYWDVFRGRTKVNAKGLRKDEAEAMAGTLSKQ